MEEGRENHALPFDADQGERWGGDGREKRGGEARRAASGTIFTTFRWSLAMAKKGVGKKGGGRSHSGLFL